MSPHQRSGLQYSAERTIAAPVSTVWSILTDRTLLVSGSFGITRLDGDLRAGGKLSLVSETVPGRAFKLKVVQFEPEHLMVWQGGMPLGLFTGARRFTLSEAAAGTQFNVEEVFTGIMAGMITRNMPDLQPSFDQFADALKSMAQETIAQEQAS